MTERYYFDTGDAVTDFNLSRLEHFASLNRLDGTSEHVHDWMLGVMQSIDSLPPSYGAKFNRYEFTIGSVHYDATDARRAEIWRRMAGKLRAMVNAAAADPTLRKDALGGAPVSGRRESRGERIERLCEELEGKGLSARGEAILQTLERERNSTIRSDVHKLRELAEPNRQGDRSQDRYWFLRHVHHMREVASQMHHLD